MRSVLARLLWALPTLLGISLLTFLLLELAPLDARTARVLDPTVTRSEQSRTAAVRALREQAGWIDPATGARRGLGERYLRWVGDVVTLRLAPPGESPASFRARIGRALAFSTLLGGLALAAAVAAGVLLGSLAGRLRGRRGDWWLGVPLLVLGSLPDFLVATLLILAVAASGVDLPTAGLQSEAFAPAGLPARFLDLAGHLVLPTLVLALGPAVAIARYLRGSIEQVRGADWVHTLRAWGLSERVVQRRVLRAAARPLWTWLGTLLPLFITGAVVVEELFALPGFGRLAFRAAVERDVATVTATTTIAAAIVLLGLVLSDLLHRLADPRVVLR